MAIRSNRPPPPKTPVTPARDNQRTQTPTTNTSKTANTQAVTSTKPAFAKDSVVGADAHRVATGEHNALSGEQGEALGAAAQKATDNGGNLRRAAGRRRNPAPVLDAGQRKVTTADTIAKEDAADALLGLDPDDAPAVKKAAASKGATAGATQAKGTATTKGAVAATGGAAAAAGSAKAGAKAASGSAKGSGSGVAKSADAGAKPNVATGAKAVAAGAGVKDGGGKPAAKAAPAGGDADGDDVIMAKAREAAAKPGGKPKGQMASQLAAQVQKAAAGGGAKKSTSTTQKSASSSGSKGSKGAKGAKSAGPAIKGGGGAPIGDVKHMRELEGQLVSDRESGGSGREVTADMAPAVAEAVAQLKANGAEVRTADKPVIEEGGAKVDTPGALRGGDRAQNDAYQVGARDVPKADIAEVARELPDSGELDKELRSALSAQRESDVQDHLQANTDASQLGSRKVSEAEPFDGIGGDVRDDGGHIDGLLMTGEERAKAAKKGATFVRGGDRRGIDFPVITADMQAMAIALGAKGIDISDITSGLEAQFDADGEGEGEEEAEEEEEEG